MRDSVSSRATRTALRVDVGKLYDAGCSCSESETPALSALFRAIPAKAGYKDRFEVLRWAIRGLGGGQRTTIAFALLGAEKTRGLSKTERHTECARLSGGRYKNWDSFRHGMERGKNVITVYLDEITDQLMAVADEHDFSHAAPPARPNALVDYLLSVSDGKAPDWLIQAAEHRPKLPGSVLIPLIDRRFVKAITVSDESGD
jgi:hypothetical protein